MAANIQVDTITDTAGTGPSNFSQGLTVSATKSVKTDILLPQTSGKSIALKGVTDGSAAAAGDVGEEIRATCAATSFGATSTFTEMVSVSLTAGDWVLNGVVDFNFTGVTATGYSTHFTTTAGANATGRLIGDNANLVDRAETGHSTLTIPGYKVSISSTTTYYLKGVAVYSAGTPTYQARISAIRIR